MRSDRAAGQRQGIAEIGRLEPSLHHVFLTLELDLVTDIITISGPNEFSM
jgi:hypothetical protein